jgi:hypothetical protein
LEDNQETVPWPDARYLGTNTHSLSYHVMNDILISRIFLLKHLVTGCNLKNHVNILSIKGKMWINDRKAL